MILPNLHRIAKFTLSFVLAFMLFIRLFIVDVSALSAAPIFGEALVEVFSTLLVGSGLYTSEEVSDMSWAEAEDAIDSGISSGAINPLEIVGDVTINGATIQANFLEWMHLISRTSTDVITSDYFGTITDASLQMTLQNYVPVTIGNWFTTVDNDDVIDTPAADMQGYGCYAKKYQKGTNLLIAEVYCEYGVIQEDGDFDYYGNGYGSVYSASDGSLMYTQSLSEGFGESFFENSKYYYEVYGDVRNYDGTAAETDDTYTDYVGEDYDGELITLEDIQAGAVPLDDTLLDYDKFTDDTIVDLLNQILAELEDVPVVENEEDNTIAEDFADELDGSVALELEDVNALMLPTGIATVFPFCLPFDFAYGLELLAAKPVAPKFEIPFEIPAFGLYPGTKDVITLDMSKYSKYFEVGRWVQIVIFSIGLCFISFKVVKGVH